MPILSSRQYGQLFIDEGCRAQFAMRAGTLVDPAKLQCADVRKHSRVVQVRCQRLGLSLAPPQAWPCSATRTPIDCKCITAPKAGKK